ncbi:hypothetical protein AAEX37_00588 [Oligella sp. MSHR50489EDL]|uniref:c-type cytochrome n=1 Tax=Oligella sp. MSHR50489EDL TaxID=3139409 RepID=UPI003D814E83
MSSTNHKGSKTPGQMLKVGALVFIVPIIVIIFLIKMNLDNGGTDRALMAPEMVLSRIAPVAHYNTGAPLPEAKSAEPLTGEQLYSKLCMTCHDSGLSGAPIKGDNAVWAPRIAQGAETLFKHSLEGFNAMPAKGGDMSLSDDEVKNAVVFMVNASGGNISFESSAGGEAATDDAAATDAATTDAAAAAEEAAASATEETSSTAEQSTSTEESAPAAESNETAPAPESTETAPAAESTETAPAPAAASATEESAPAPAPAAESAEPSPQPSIQEVPLNQQVPEQDSAVGTVSPSQTDDPANPLKN